MKKKKKTLLMNGSPRKGNTKFAVDLLKEKLGAQGELVEVGSLDLMGCTACEVCRKKGDGRCITPDQTNGLLNQMREADQIIFATPVYFWGISAQLKLAVDKMYADVDGLRGDKSIGVIAIGADTLDGPQYGIIRDQFRCISKFMNWDYDFYLPICAGEKDDVSKDPGVQEKILGVVC